MNSEWSIDEAKILISNYSLKHNKPREGCLEITKCCNFRCVHCYLKGAVTNRKEIDFKQICLVLDQLADLGVFFVSLTGGEPLLRPDFWDIMSYARKRGLAVSFTTNASLIDSDSAKKLADLAIAEVKVSIYGMTQDSFQKVTRTKGDFRKVLTGVETLVKLEIPVYAKMMLFNINFSDLKKFKDWATKLRLSQSLKWEYYPCIGRESLLEPFKNAITDSQAQKLVAYSDELAIDRLRGQPGSEWLLCTHGVHNHVFIDSYGGVSPCFFITNRANVNDKTIGEIIKDDPYFVNFRSIRFKDAKKCLNCHLVRYCKPCPATFYLFTRKLTSSCPPRLMCETKRGKLKKIMHDKQKLLKETKNGATISADTRNTKPSTL
jgi:radical SAM protein with 4Fe4S-binding SPASM domain